MDNSSTVANFLPFPNSLLMYMWDGFHKMGRDEGKFSKGDNNFSEVIVSNIALHHDGSLRYSWFQLSEVLRRADWTFLDNLALKFS